jgi:hypothetical protein
VDQLQVFAHDADEHSVREAMNGALIGFVEGIDSRLLKHHRASDAVVPLVMALKLNPNYDAGAAIPRCADFPGFDEIEAEAERRLHHGATHQARARPVAPSPDRPGRVGGGVWSPRRR